SLDPVAAVPAHDRGWDLVANRVTEHGRVAGAGPDACAYALLDRLDALRLVQEGHVLLPRQPYQDVEAVLVREVEQPAGWHRIGPDRVDAVRGHRGEVLGDRLEPGKVVSVLVGAEGPVGDTADVQFLAVEIDVLPAH